MSMCTLKVNIFSMQTPNVCNNFIAGTLFKVNDTQDICLRQEDCDPSIFNPVVDTILSFVSYIGIVLSIIGLILTIITMLAFK